MTDRRSILRGLASLPAMAAPAVLMAAIPDPIFAAIERHRQADEAHKVAVMKRAHLIDIPAELEAESGAASDAEVLARHDMHEIVPTTMAGLMAYVAHWQEYTSKDRWSLEQVGWEAFPTIAEALQTIRG